MKEKDVYAELSSIRSLMERSSKFISLSGLAGIWAGFYALTGAFLGNRIILSGNGSIGSSDYDVNDPAIWWQLLFIALVVLILALSTGVWLTMNQAKKKGENFWNPVSRRLLAGISVPLITGGLFIILLIMKGHYDLIASSSLIFYGLALIAGSPFTFSDVKWLGFCEILLGLIAVLVPGYDIILWAIGFGVLHILYGSIMHFKYKQ